MVKGAVFRVNEQRFQHTGRGFSRLRPGIKAIATLAILLFVILTETWATAASGGEPGLVAYYTFDEGSGAILKDRSGNGNDGIIHGAEYVKLLDGFCLAFDGVDDYVDCGQGPSLNLQGAATLEAWVFPDIAVMGEPGIAGKHFSSYLLTYYTNGKAYWYIREGGNCCQAVLAPGSWHHLVGTFDGTSMRLFVDGKPADARTSKHREIGGGGHFTIGAVMGDPEADDPATRSTSYLPGKIAEVRVYGRALSTEEVSAHYERGFPRFGLAEFKPPLSGEKVGADAVSVVAGPQGAIEVRTAAGLYVAESAYSRPGDRIGWNTLGFESGLNEPEWSPRARKVGNDEVTIEAKGSLYSVTRRVVVRGDRIEFEDRLRNTGPEAVGVILENRVVSPRPFQDILSAGSPESPLIYARAEADTLGLLVEDDIARRKFEAHLGLPINQLKFRVMNLAVDASKTYTMRWTLYVLPPRADYFDLVNKVRHDWNSVTTIEGPCDWFDVGQRAGLLQDPEALRAYFHRKRQRLVLLSPWLDYDPGTFDRVWTRDEYKQRMQEAARLIRQANPEAKVLGCIETDWVAIDPTRIPGGDALPAAGQSTGNVRLTAEQTKIIDASGLSFLDSVRRDADGNVMLELYRRGGKPQTSLAVFPALGNHQFEFLLGQVEFLINEVGLDGFYIDEFSQAFRNDLRTYDGWDGCSAEIDLRTGGILRRYVDCSIAGIEARVRLCRYALERGKVIVANSYATSAAEQPLPVNRFSETQGSINPFGFEDGREPPLVTEILRGNLATPIGLGIVAQPGQTNVAKTIMKAVVAYLRHGTVYYHYAIGDIPEAGDGSGEYGPINHMFPITPLELHKGWILGKERIVTCVSGEYAWPHRRPPTVHLFDLQGREVPCEFQTTQTAQGRQVILKLADWAEIAVIE